jgi:hypothetical protein
LFGNPHASLMEVFEIRHCPCDQSTHCSKLMTLKPDEFVLRDDDSKHYEQQASAVQECQRGVLTVCLLPCGSVGGARLSIEIDAEDDVVDDEDGSVVSFQELN